MLDTFLQGYQALASGAQGDTRLIASRSATECAAILDAARRVNIVSERLHAEGRALLLRIVSMLTKLAKRHNTL